MWFNIGLQFEHRFPMIRTMHDTQPQSETSFLAKLRIASGSSASTGQIRSLLTATM
jgi:hypothetical protein